MKPAGRIARAEEGALDSGHTGFGSSRSSTSSLASRSYEGPAATAVAPGFQVPSPRPGRWLAALIHKHENHLLASFIFLLTAAAFLPALRNGFITFDDPDYITTNTRVQAGLNWASLKWALADCETSSNWHPLTLLSHMLDCQLFGLKPWGHHLTSVMLHALNAALVFLVLVRLTRRRWLSLLAAALFALHPLRVESVAWVSERKDVLSACFFLLSIWAYIRFAATRGSTQVSRPAITNEGAKTSGPTAGTTSTAKDQKSKIENGSWPAYFAALLCFALGLMSKPMVVTLPFVLLLLDYWPLRRTARSTFLSLVMEKLPFFVLSVASSVITFLVQSRGGATAMVIGLSFVDRVHNMFISYCRYVGMFLWPVNLSVFYPFPQPWWTPKQVLAASLAVCGACVLALALRRRRPYALVGWFWFLGTLVPAIGLVQVGQQSIADRYTYLPSIGLCVLFAWGLCDLTRHWRWQTPLLCLVGIGTAVFLWLCTWRQLSFWKDAEALFRHSLTVTGNYYLPHINIGVVLADKGRFDEAILEYEEALRLHPNDYLVYNDIGLALAGKGRLDDAKRAYREALRLRPGCTVAHDNLAIVLIRQGRLDEATLEYRAAVSIPPESAQQHFFLGCVLSQQQKWAEAGAEFERASQIEPTFPDVQGEWAYVLEAQGQIGPAITHLENALKGKPGDPEARNRLGMLLAKTHRLDEAIVQFRRAMTLSPGDLDIRSNLSIALSEKAATRNQDASSSHAPPR